MADARAKAEVLAEAAGLKITGIEEISEGGAYSYDNAVGNFRAAQMDKGTGSAATVVQAAKLVVTVTVNITFTAPLFISDADMLSHKRVVSIPAECSSKAVSLAPWRRGLVSSQ